MKTVKLEENTLDLNQVIHLAENEPVLLLAGDGREFIISAADDFEQEVAALRNSKAFQQFLLARSKSTTRIPLEEIEREIEAELKR